METIATPTHVENAGEIVLIIFHFLFLLFICAAIKKKLFRVVILSEECMFQNQLLLIFLS